MERTFTPAAAHRGAVLAGISALLTGLSAPAAAWAARAEIIHTADLADPPVIIGSVATVVVALGCLRLSWVCGRAMQELLELARRSVITPAPDAAGRPVSHPSVSDPSRPATSLTCPSPRRAAGLFLAAATAFAISTQPAQAATPPPGPTFSVSVTTPTEHQSHSVGPLSSPGGFCGSDVSKTGALPSADPSSPAAASDSLPSQPGQRLGDGRATTAPPPPQPGWTPPVQHRSTAVAPVLLGAAAFGIIDADEPTTHVIHRGDTLWQIVATRLGPEASGQSILQALPAWFAANPGLADHPDQLRAGDTLAVPQDVHSAALTGSLR